MGYLKRRIIEAMEQKEEPPTDARESLFAVVYGGGEEAVKAVQEYLELRGEICDSITDVFAQSRWIPVSERLPEEGERVLFYNADDEHKYAIMVRVGRCIDDGPTGTRELRIVDFASPAVTATHWMPLPELPEVT